MAEPQVTGGRRQDVARALLVLRVMVLVLLATCALLFARQLGEGGRTAAAVDRQAAALAIGVQADCELEQQLAGLAGQVVAARQRLSPTLARISAAAAHAYTLKGCPTAVDARTGRLFGPAPVVPSPGPAR